MKICFLFSDHVNFSGSVAGDTPSMSCVSGEEDKNTR